MFDQSGYPDESEIREHVRKHVPGRDDDASDVAGDVAFEIGKTYAGGSVDADATEYYDMLAAWENKHHGAVAYEVLMMMEPDHEDVPRVGGAREFTAVESATEIMMFAEDVTRSAAVESTADAFVRTIREIRALPETA